MPGGSESVSCVWCGTTVEDVPITWTVQTSERGVEYLCEKCTRDNARQIESLAADRVLVSRDRCD